MVATIPPARSARLAAAASLMVLLVASAPAAWGQAQPVPGTPTEGQNRYGDFRDEQGQGRTGDIRDDARALGREIREGASAVVEGAQDLVDGDDTDQADTRRSTRRNQAARRVTAEERAAREACARSDLDAQAMRDLQRELNELWGSNGPAPGAVDGLCGPRTVASIKAFQAAQGMDVDGVPSRSVTERVREVAQGPSTGPGAPMTDATTSPAMPPAPSDTPAAGGPTTPPSEPAAMPSSTAGTGTMTPQASEASVPGSPPGDTPAPGTTTPSTMPGQPVTPTTPSAPASPLPTTTDPATGQPR